MIAVDLKTFAEDVSGRIVRGSGDAVVSGVLTDSRMNCKGAIFVPIAGENFDGHDYVTAAVEKGALGFLWSKSEGPPAAGNAAVIRVEDTLAAYQAAGSANRERAGALVIGLTGSSGKTTTKGMLANLLSGYRTVSTSKNENNEIGVPKTLLSIDENTQYCIVEMGMRAKGEIDEIAFLAHPDYGLITNIGLTHVGRLGSEKEIALAKAELLAHVHPAGKVFLNADNAWTPMLVRMSPAEVITFGIDSGEVRCVEAGYSLEGVFLTVAVNGSGGEFELSVPVPGRAGTYNALACVAIGVSLGMSHDEISARLSQPVSESGRMRKVNLSDGTVVLDDTYNANPDSVKLAMDLLGRVKWEGRKVAVLADMLELGDMSEEEHFKVGSGCAKFVDAIVTIGKDAGKIADGARKSGKIDESSVRDFADFESFEAEAGLLFRAGDLVLVKGSRGMKMERVVKLLEERGC